MSGPFEFLHIKRRTEGSSNELSFDVLDAARTDIDNRKKHGSRVPIGPKPSQGSYHGVAGTSTLSAAPEVERRKRARRAHTARVWAIAVVAIATLVGVGVYLGVQFHQDKMDFNGQYRALVDRLVEIDKTLVKVDALMERPLEAAGELYSYEEARASDETPSQGSASALGFSSSPEGEEVEGVLNSFPSLKRELNSVSAESQRMKELAANDADLAALSQVKVAAEARLSMVSVGGEALELVIGAGKRMARANAEWEKVLEADSIARDAAEMANSAGTEEATRIAKNETEKARGLFMEAKEGLTALERGNPAIDYSAEKKYVEKRIESLSAALKTSEALLSNNREAAEKANNEYNAADREAVALAMKLPPSEKKKVEEAYGRSLKEVSRNYDDVRAVAANADSSIRSYLGNHS